MVVLGSLEDEECLEVRVGLVASVLGSSRVDEMSVSDRENTSIEELEGSCDSCDSTEDDSTWEDLLCDSSGLSRDRDCTNDRIEGAADED